jgi:phage terminase large subunit-like protein
MAVVSAPKKTGKTNLSASVALWYLCHAGPEAEIILAANAAHQSTFVIFRKLSKSIQLNPYLGPNVIRILNDSIENLRDGTIARVVATNVRSIAGLEPNLVIIDELHAYRRDIASQNDEEFFNELALPPTVKDALLLISSYAGFEEDSLLHDIYLKGLEGSDPKMFFFWSHDPFLSPRTTPEFLEDRRKKEHPNTYARLWENRWTQGIKEFVSMNDYDKCVDLNYSMVFEDLHRELRVYLGIDIGVKSDCSAVVAVAKQGDKIALIQHRIWKPGPNDPVDIRDVENYILELSKKFNIAEAHFDPSQFLEGERRLRDAGVNIIQATQAEGLNVARAQNLYQLFRSGTLKLYHADDLRAHVQHASIKESSKGFQIEKSAPSKKIDAAVALSFATFACVKGSGGAAEVYVSTRSVYGPDINPVDITNGDFLRNDR